MPSKLDQLKSMTIVVADTGDMESIGVFKPVDCTTNPTLILKAAQLPTYQSLFDEAVAWGKKTGAGVERVTDRLAVSFGAELCRVVPGRVSTEVDADLSFDTQAMAERGRALIADYESRGVGRQRILIKLASTWEGIRAAEILQKERIDCNMTLIFSLAQAAAAADAGAFLISPFVGRILDWHVKASGKSYTAETDPGVLSVRAIHNYYKTHGVKTIVMGASFRNTGEIEALAGCDRLTISPALLEALRNDSAELPRKLSPHDRVLPPPERLVLDEKAFRFALNEDAMASEKLAEGIRLFTADLRTLRAMARERRQALA